MADLDRTGDLEVKVVGTDGITQASVTSSHRMQVSAQLESGGDNPIFALQSFTPYVQYNASSATYQPNTYTSLLSVSNEEGKLDFIAIACNGSDYQVKLDVDSVTVYDITMNELNIIGLSNAENVDIWVETANKNFRHRPNIPLDYKTSFDVYVKSGVTATMNYLITYRIAGGD